MENVVAVVLALLSGAAAHYELTEFNKTASDGKVPPIAAGVAGFVVALFIAMLAPAIVLGVIVGEGTFRGVQVYERQAKQQLFGLQTLIWAGAAGALGFFGGSLFGVAAWFAACAFAGFSGAFYLLFMDRQRLQAENRMWISENQRLLIERNGRSAAASTRPAAAPAPAEAAPLPSRPPLPNIAAAAAPAPAPDPRPGAVRKPATWGAPAQPAAAPYAAPRPGGGDFLPRR